jgi:hypothetical protein
MLLSSPVVKARARKLALYEICFRFPSNIPSIAFRITSKFDAISLAPLSIPRLVSVWCCIGVSCWIAISHRDGLGAEAGADDRYGVGSGGVECWCLSSGIKDVDGGAETNVGCGVHVEGSPLDLKIPDNLSCFLCLSCDAI